jgi:signal transduction histidine kinase
MRQGRSSLRFRVAFTFAWFGALVSLLLAIGLYFSAHDLGKRLIDETLQAEMEDYLARRARNPHSLPPNTLSLRGYVVVPGEAQADVPDAVRELPLGRYETQLDGVPHRTIVTQRDGLRYVMLFDQGPQLQRENRFVFYLAGGILIMALLSAAGGYWLAGRVVEPVVRLSKEVSDASPEGQSPALSEHFSEDELGELARAFDNYLSRLRAFIDRERAFTADVSHELRTPLAVIQGATEVLEGDPTLNPKQKQRIDRIERAGRDMTELTTALLLMAREETAGAQPDEQCAVTDVVLDCVEKNRHLIEGRPATLDLRLDAEPALPAERTLLGIVIGNLIRNAFSYTETGTIAIRLKADRLVVSDTGIGIKADELARVFQRYYKGSASKGSGIGLSLVKRICDRYGWEVLIESRENEGTTAQLLFAPGVA